MTSMFDCINQSWWRWESPEIFTGQSSVLYSNCIWQSDFMLYRTHIVCFLCLHHLLIYPTMKSASNQIPFILQWKLPQTEPLLPYSETYLKWNPFYPTVKPASNWTLFGVTFLFENRHVLVFDMFNLHRFYILWLEIILTDSGFIIDRFHCILYNATSVPEFLKD